VYIFAILILFVTPQLLVFYSRDQLLTLWSTPAVLSQYECLLLISPMAKVWILIRIEIRILHVRTPAHPHFTPGLYSIVASDSAPPTNPATDP